MADVVVVIDPGGTGDYESLAAAHADRGNGFDNDLVGAGTDNLIFRCICTNGAADTGDSVVMEAAHYTVDATHKIIIEVPEAYQHRGCLPTSGNYYRMTASGNGGIFANVDYTTVRGVAINYAPMPFNQAFFTNRDEVLFDRCYAYNTTPDMGHANDDEDWGFGCNVGSGYTVYFRNCYASGNRGPHGEKSYPLYTLGTGGNIYVYNCTFVTGVGRAAVLRDGPNNIIKNCLLHGGYYADAGGGDALDIWGDANIHDSSTHNAYFHAQRPAKGSNWRDYGKWGQVVPGYTLSGNLAGLFENLDYTALLKSGSIQPEGIDLRNDATLPVTDDILGNSRGDRPYIGAHQLQRTSTPTSKSGRQRRKRTLRAGKRYYG